MCRHAPEEDQIGSACRSKHLRFSAQPAERDQDDQQCRGKIYRNLHPVDRTYGYSRVQNHQRVLSAMQQCRTVTLPPLPIYAQAVSCFPFLTAQSLPAAAA